MEKDYRTASGKFWQTVRRLRRVWQSGTVPLDWETGVVVPLLKKGDRRVCSNYRVITLLSLPGKVYSRVLERRVRLLVEPRIQEEQCGFRPGRGTLDQLYTLHRVLEGSWEFAQPVQMCFVDLEKAFDRVPRGILWEVLWEYGVRGSLLRAVRSLYNRSRSLVRNASYDVVLLAPSSLDLQHALGRFAAEFEAAGMRVSTSKSEAMVLDQKKVACTLQIFGFVNGISPVGNDQQNLLAFRFSALNPVVDPWVFIIFRKSTFQHVRALLHCRFSKAAVKNTAPDGFSHHLESMVPAESTALQSKIYCGIPQHVLDPEPILRQCVNEITVGCELEEKESFWSELDEVMESIPTGERVVIGADFNGHVGEGNTGDEEVMGKFGVKERNLEGQMVVDFAKRMDMGVVNTYFQKREEHRVTYKSGGRRTQVVLPDDWETTAEVIRETGRKVLGVSSGRRKEDKETWWWNEEVQDSIQRKRLAKKKWDMDRTEENRQEYKELQCRVKREVSKAKQKAYDELYTRLDTREGEKDLYRLARQRNRDGKDVQQKVDKIRKDEVRKALKRMKSGKAGGPDDIPVEVWKCLGEAAVEFLASLFNRVLESERMPEEWRRNLEKAYDRVPREELWYCMRKSGVAEKYVRVVQDMYERSRTVVRCAVGQAEEFKVEVGLHQGSALSPFLFAIVMDQLSEEVRQESPWTMMFADDIVICSESRKQVEENLERWRFALERRGMKVSRIQSNGECGKEVKKRVQAETVPLRKRQESELEVAELKMLRFSLGVTRLDRIRNEYIRGTAHVGRLGDKVREARLRWFGHVQRRESENIDEVILVGQAM
ncbi:hypothetical protein QTP86_009653 [Hemibagrus guttatus]|nr:hypothetical protein QTP86_009653 [Hemibagrus guttatus]